MKQGEQPTHNRCEGERERATGSEWDIRAADLLHFSKMAEISTEDAVDQLHQMFGDYDKATLAAVLEVCSPVSRTYYKTSRSLFLGESKFILDSSSSTKCGCICHRAVTEPRVRVE